MYKLFPLLKRLYLILEIANNKRDCKNLGFAAWYENWHI